MFQWLLAILSNPVVSSLIGAVVGFIASFVAQDQLENRKFKRALTKQVWEEKARVLHEFSKDLALWFYLFSLESYESHARKGDELERLGQKLIREKTFLLRYPEIYALYEKLAELTEEPHAMYLEPRERETLEQLLKRLQYEIQLEADRISR